ncbi:MAG: GDP-mannose 4,6-dehydratase, partial [Gemmataceae bacterium]
MRVLVTGGYGFLGAWIARDLLDRGHEPVLFDLASNPRRLEMVLSAREIGALSFAQGDVADCDRVVAACREHSVGGIIHLA